MDDVELKKPTLDDKFDELKKMFDEHKRVRDSLREIFDKLNGYRDEKKKLVEFIRKAKEERNKAQGVVREKAGLLRNVSEKKKELSDIDDFERLCKQIDQIEWKIWTETMPYKKEEELVKMRKELEAKLGKAKEKESVFKSENEARNELGTFMQEQKLLHSCVMRYAKDWELIDSDMKKLSAGIDEKKKKLAELDIKITALKAEIGTAKGEMKHRHAEERAEKEKESKAFVTFAEKQLDKRIQEVMEKFKKSKKLTTEDLIVLSKSDKNLL
jgi:phosphoserine phosphatase